MKALLLFFFLAITVTLHAQKTAEIEGQWIFDDIENAKGKDALDSKSIEMLKSLYSETAFDFADNGNYTVKMMGRMESGTYEVKKQKVIEMTSKDGAIKRLDLVDCDEQYLTIRFEGRKKGAIVMKRSGELAKDNTDSSGDDVESKFVIASKTEVAKKWFLHERVVGEPIKNSVPIEEQDEAFKAMQETMQTVTFEMMPDGVFKSDGPSGLQLGTWAFGDTNDTIIVTGPVETNWKVFSISEDELVLKLDFPNTSEYYFFGSVSAAN